MAVTLVDWIGLLYRFSFSANPLSYLGLRGGLGLREVNRLMERLLLQLLGLGSILRLLAPTHHLFFYELLLLAQLSVVNRWRPNE